MLKRATRKVFSGWDSHSLLVLLTVLLVLGLPVFRCYGLGVPAAIGIGTAAVDDTYDHSPWLLIAGGVILILMTRWRKNT